MSFFETLNTVMNGADLSFWDMQQSQISDLVWFMQRVLTPYQSNAAVQVDLKVLTVSKLKCHVCLDRVTRCLQNVLRNIQVVFGTLRLYPSVCMCVSGGDTEVQGWFQMSGAGWGWGMGDRVGGPNNWTTWCNKGTRWKVRESPKLLQYILRTSMYVPNAMAIPNSFA